MPAIRASEQIPGKGVTATLDQSAEHQVMVGSPDWIASLYAGSAPDVFPDAMAIDVVVNQQWQGRCWIADHLRADAAEGVAQLRDRHVSVEILSGDRDASVARIADELGGIPYVAKATPELKSERLDHHRDSGRHVAMVGDGFNDATAMAHATLGIAMANGARLTLETADLTMTSRTPVLAAAQSLLFAKTVMRRVRENLGFAFGFNLLAIPLAMTGLLSPSIAATEMALSSTAVMTNAARLLRWAPPQKRN
jgi:Cu+-exporting ATPase